MSAGTIAKEPPPPPRGRRVVDALLLLAVEGDNDTRDVASEVNIPCASTPVSDSDARGTPDTRTVSVTFVETWGLNRRLA